MKDQKYRILVKYDSNNPLLKTTSVQKLVTFLQLDEVRIMKLLERDQIYVDSYANICVRETRGLISYQAKKTIYKIKVKG